MLIWYEQVMLNGRLLCVQMAGPSSMYFILISASVQEFPEQIPRRDRVRHQTGEENNL